MKPVYTNQFFCLRNSYNSEVIIEFKHGYIEHNISVKEEVAVTTVVNKIEDVTSLCLTLSDAIALRDSLDKIIGDTYTPKK